MSAMKAKKSRQPSVLGATILAWLSHKGWTAADLAAEAEIPETTLSHIISGYSRKPKLEQLDALARAMDMPLIDILHVLGYDSTPSAAKTREEELALLLSLDPDLRNDMHDLALLDKDALHAIRSMIMHYKTAGKQSKPRQRGLNNDDLKTSQP